MESTQELPDKTNDAERSCCAPTKAKRLNARNVLIIAALVGGGAALFFGWDWLVAAGVAGLVISVAPCLAMCALGVCASRMTRKDGSQAPNPISPVNTPQKEPR